MDPRARPSLALLIALSLAGCGLVGDILVAGFWAGVVVLVLVPALVVWGVFQLFG